MNFSHVRLLVSDFDGCFRFYRDVMGWKPTWGQEGDTYASFESENGQGVALFDRAEMAEAVGTTALPVDVESQDRFVLIVEVGDLNETAQRLRERSMRLIAGPEDRPDWGIRVAYLRDPDGNLIELNSPMPKDEWTDDLREVAESFSK